jgi:TonB family protein
MRLAGQKAICARVFGLAGTVLVHIAFMLVWLMSADPSRDISNAPVITVNLIRLVEPDVPIFRPSTPQLSPVQTSLVIPEFPELEVTPEELELTSRSVTEKAEADRGSESYHRLFARYLGRHLEYPARSKLLGEEGSAVVRILIMRNGTVTLVEIEKSSGFETLDEEAIAVVWRAQPFPPPPRVFPGDPVTLIVPIEFHVGPKPAVQGS